MAQQNGQHKQPQWTAYHAARRVPGHDRRHRPVHHRHGFVFGFPNCSASQLDDYFDDRDPIAD